MDYENKSNRSWLSAYAISGVMGGVCMSTIMSVVLVGGNVSTKDYVFNGKIGADLIRYEINGQHSYLTKTDSNGKKITFVDRNSNNTVDSVYVLTAKDFQKFGHGKIGDKVLAKGNLIYKATQEKILEYKQNTILDQLK